MHLPAHTPLPQLREARKALHERGLVQAKLLHEPLARSWERCVRAGLAPERAEVDIGLVHGERLRTVLAHNREFMATARPVLGFLHEQIRDTGNLVVLADTDGLLLHAIGDDSFVARAARVALMPGACWGETVRGTNAVGTALAEGQAVVVHGGEHFLDAHGFLTCSAAPIFDSLGRPLGVVDISGDHRSRHPHTLALVRSAARMIEDRLFGAHHAQHLRMHLHPQAEGMHGIGEGLVALTEDGWIVGANGIAMSWLGLHAREIGACTTLAVFGIEAGDLRAAIGRPRRLQLPDGRLLWATVERPQAGLLATSTPSAGDAATDADPRVAEARRRAGRALAAGLTVLLLGESGTGKDVFARELHARGPRRSGPFVAVNCASLPETLIEAELFGYVGGAYTGARREGAPGHFREADGGTLFLDEIGDMPLALQTRLLRVLEERRVLPLGASHAVPVDVQLIAATHQDLRSAIARGTFRSDLFYRLNGLSLQLPALRERTDFAALSAAMLREVRPETPPRLTVAVAAAMRRFAWPGNLRQLRSVLTAAAAMLEHGEHTIDWQHLPDDVREELRTGRPAAPAALPGADANLRELSDRAIAETIAATGRNMSEAARRLGISRNTLYRRLRQMRAR